MSNFEGLVELLKIFAQLVNVDLTMKMYKNGKIKSIEGSDKLISNMVNAVGDLDDFTKEVMKESMKGEFSNESLAMSFEQMTYIYPNKTVKTGDSWENDFEGDLSSKNTWTLESINKDDIIITGKSIVNFVTNDNDIEIKKYAKKKGVDSKIAEHDMTVDLEFLGQLETENKMVNIKRNYKTGSGEMKVDIKGGDKNFLIPILVVVSAGIV